jgi:Family of unknown function (DUF6084)
MSELNFQIDAVEALKHAASPALVFKLRATRPAQPAVDGTTQLDLARVDDLLDFPIQSVLLQCQIQIESARRKYTPDEQSKLQDLFGKPERWTQTLRTMYWTTESVNVPGFKDSTVVDLRVPCSFDFNLAATKYFAGLSDGHVPLCFLFSGTVFYTGENGLQIGQIPWNKEAKFRLPVAVWHDMMNHYYPNGAWLRLRRDVFDQLFQYKVDHGIPSWEQAIEKLLAAATADSVLQSESV